jgi:acyl-CoA synthetase (AMP-forming)/AMP-acid ligase II
MKHNELYFVGREKDLIIVGGRNYYPQDLEQTVESFANIRPGILSCELKTHFRLHVVPCF